MLLLTHTIIGSNILAVEMPQENIQHAHTRAATIRYRDLSIEIYRWDASGNT
jgi:hypothetical protein